jgi:hypothetical protein
MTLAALLVVLAVAATALFSAHIPGVRRLTGAAPLETKAPADRRITRGGAS